MLLVCSQIEQLDRSTTVLGHALVLYIEITQTALRRPGQSVPFNRSAIALGHTSAFFITETKLNCVSAFPRSTAYFCRSLVPVLNRLEGSSGAHFRAKTVKDDYPYCVFARFSNNGWRLKTFPVETHLTTIV